MGLEITGRYRYPDPDPQWLALRTEPALDPTLPIVDAHHHLWEEPGKRYLARDLTAELSTCGHNVIATVFVQCYYGYRSSGPEHLRPIGETECIEAMRRSTVQQTRTRICAGIIGFADLLSADSLEPVLDAHQAASPGHFRGVRQSVARDSNFPQGIVLKPAPVGMLADPVLRSNVGKLGRRDLIFEVLLYHQQLNELIPLAQEAPDTPIVVNHFGCPIGVGPYRGREREVFDAWRKDMTELAACPNVYVKLGGMGMIVTGANFHMNALPPTSEELSGAWYPYVQECIELFSAERCLVESNFPIDKAMYSYAVLWNAFKRLTAAASSTEREALFAGTAKRLYRLNLG